MFEVRKLAAGKSPHQLCTPLGRLAGPVTVAHQIATS
jgi:hypothetical protein